jgi:hypothetical protein
MTMPRCSFAFYVEKRKLLSFFAERPFLENGRGERPNFEQRQAVQPFLVTFLNGASLSPSRIKQQLQLLGKRQ